MAATVTARVVERPGNMLVSRWDFTKSVEQVSKSAILAVDTEGTGLRTFHGDRLFSIILATANASYYFNFNQAPDIPDEFVLGPEHKAELAKLLAEDRVYFFHNYTHDAAQLEAEGIFVGGTIHDTKVGARLLMNDHFEYSLDAVAERAGFQKSDVVNQYIADNGLWDWEDIPGKKQRVRKPYFSKVPLDIIAPYGCQDGRITYDIGVKQIADFEATLADRKPLLDVLHMERQLSRVVYQMQRRGIMVDLDYCERAIAYWNQQMDMAEEAWRELTGVEFVDSGVYFAKHLPPSGKLTKKSTVEKPRQSYSADALEAMAAREVPAAKAILKIRDAKKQVDMLRSFLYHQSSSIMHASFDQAGTKTGRFAHHSPNLAQLNKDESPAEDAFPVRRALVPRPGYVFVLADWNQQEYRLMLDIAGLYTSRSELIEKVLNGLDVHQATADVAGITRSQAKTTNFAVLYGAGLNLLAGRLGLSLQEAKRVKASVMDAAPEIQLFLSACERTARARGYIHNWFGRRWYCPDPRYAYRAPNYYCQGGGADVVKVAMVQLPAKLEGLDAHLVLQIHDELVLEVREDQALEAARRAKAVMEAVYPARFLPLTVGVDWSPRSLADKSELSL